MILRAFIFCFALVIAGCTTLGINHPICRKPKDVFRFSTYNLFCEDGNTQDHHEIIKIIREIEPDIMLFQESQCISGKYMRKHLGRLYPYQLYLHYKDGIAEHEDGLGIISRYPIIKNCVFPPVYGWSPGWIFFIKTPWGCIQVFNAHLHPKLIRYNSVGLLGEGLWYTPHYRLNEIRYYHHLLDPRLPTIIAGDFNEGDDDQVARYLRNNCFFDTLNCIPKYIKTWHWPVGPFTLTGRYDRIYNSKHFEFLHSQVVQKGESDHYPVFVDYHLAK